MPIQPSGNRCDYPAQAAKQYSERCIFGYQGNLIVGLGINTFFPFANS